MSVKNKNKNKRKINNRKNDLQSQIIQRKNDEIESLKSKISLLEIDIDKKNELINSVDCLRLEMKDILDDIDDKRNEYDALVKELFEMRNIMCKELFGGELRWRIIRFLMK